MRLWSINANNLDSIGLIALWRESLLARKVLQGKTKGYTNHPQLLRFKNSSAPLVYMENYLLEVFEVAKTRGFNFDQQKIDFTLAAKVNLFNPITINNKQIEYELSLIKFKKQTRKNKKGLLGAATDEDRSTFRIFTTIEGDIESWERVRNELIPLLDNDIAKE